MSVEFSGVFPAITTPFLPDGSIDMGFLVEHAKWMIAEGCHGIVPCGSLGEAGTLTFDEKVAIVKALADALPGVPVIPGVSALSTAEAVKFIHAAEGAGAAGFMVLPPYAYSTDWREMKAHMTTCMKATAKPCILYNNPIAYKTDFTPAQIAELAAEIPNLAAVKESSADVRRIAEIRRILGDRVTLMMGVDDAIVEGLRMGVSGWIAGLVNAFPRESVALWRWTMDGRTDEADQLYFWFLPLLRLDVVPKFVQLIKLTQEKVGKGSARVRAPRLELVGEELADALATIDKGIRERPQV